MNEHANPRRGNARSSLIVLVALAFGFGAGWLAFGRAPRVQTETGRAPAATGADVDTLWTCSMHPQVIQRGPGECPICHMKLVPLGAHASAAAMGHAGSQPAERRVRYWIDASSEPQFTASGPGTSPTGHALVPVYAEEISAGDVITIDPRVTQNMGIRTAEVVEGALVRTLRLPGVLVEPEPNQVDVTVRVAGWVEHLTADTDGVHVVRGAPLFELSSPELSVAIEELIAARKTKDAMSAQSSAAHLFELQKRKLVALGIDPAEIERLAAMDRAPATVPITAPVGGHVMMKSVVEGARIEAGARALRISDNSRMWVEFALSSSDVAFVQIGQHARVTVQSLGGRVYEGNVDFLHPHFDLETRSAMARLSVDNADWKLRDGMYATVEVAVEVSPRTLLVPREAVIDTGLRRIAFVVLPDGSFEPTRVRLGASGDAGLVQVLAGLAPGDRVVTSGQFLLDAESRVRESVKKFLAADASGMSAPSTAGRLDEAEAPAELVDGVLGPYFELATLLGADQPTGRPFNALPLTVAAQKLVDGARGPTKTRAEELRTQAFALIPAGLEEQRRLFAPLSEAVVAIVQRAPPSAAFGAEIYVVHCPMAPGSWLSAAHEVHNPFYANSMKSCGEFASTIVPARSR